MALKFNVVLFCAAALARRGVTIARRATANRSIPPA